MRMGGGIVLAWLTAGLAPVAAMAPQAAAPIAAPLPPIRWTGQLSQAA